MKIKIFLMPFSPAGEQEINKFMEGNNVTNVLMNESSIVVVYDKTFLDKVEEE